MGGRSRGNIESIDIKQVVDRLAAKNSKGKKGKAEAGEWRVETQFDRKKINEMEELGIDMNERLQLEQKRTK